MIHRIAESVETQIFIFIITYFRDEKTDGQIDWLVDRRTDKNNTRVNTIRNLFANRVQWWIFLYLFCLSNVKCYIT